MDNSLFFSKFLRDILETKYDCECPKCGYTETSSKHCKDIKCKKCGAKMRRKSRPGKGKDSK